METNYNIQTGRLFDENGCQFDITVILNFPTDADYAASTSIDDFPAVNLIDFYFGDTNDSDTEWYLNQFIEKQSKLLKLYNKLIALQNLDPDDTELIEQIEFVKSMLVKLH